jgi:hypothetical protein
LILLKLVSGPLFNKEVLAERKEKPAGLAQTLGCIGHRYEPHFCSVSDVVLYLLLDLLNLDMGDAAKLVYNAGTMIQMSFPPGKASFEFVNLFGDFLGCNHMLW